MAKAAHLAGGDQETRVPAQEVAHPDQGADLAARDQLDGPVGTNLEPPAIEEQAVDPKPTTGEVIVEDDEGPAISEVPVVEGTQTGSSAVMEVVQTDAAAEPMGEGAAGQGEHPEEGTKN